MLSEINVKMGTVTCKAIIIQKGKKRCILMSSHSTGNSKSSNQGNTDSPHQWKQEMSHEHLNIISFH